MSIDKHGYKFCSDNDRLCTMDTGKQILAYGAKESYVFRTYDNNDYNKCVYCSDHVYGDPLRNVAKHCYTKAFPSITYSNGIPVGYKKISGQGGTFIPTENVTILYGADGKYYGGFQEADKIIGCRDDVFGDPAPGIGKSCYIPIVEKLDGYSLVAKEGETFKLNKDSTVLYGNNNIYNKKTIKAGESVVCGNNKFGDPLPSKPKVCYAKPL